MGTTYFSTKLIQSRFPRHAESLAYDLTTPPWYFDQRLTKWLSEGRVGHRTDIATGFFSRTQVRAIDAVTLDMLQAQQIYVMATMVGRERTVALDFIAQMYAIKQATPLPNVFMTSNYKRQSCAKRRAAKRPPRPHPPTAHQLHLAAQDERTSERRDFLQI
jgi:hypothetical protein